MVVPSVLESGSKRSERFENLDGDHDVTSRFGCQKGRYCTLELPIQLIWVSAFANDMARHAQRVVKPYLTHGFSKWKIPDDSPNC